MGSFSDPNLRPPTNGNGFFLMSGAYNQYSQDFLAWYNSCLIQHGQDMITDALIALKNSTGLENTTLEIKMPGVSWMMDTSSGMPRSAEMCAGLVTASAQQNPASYGCDSNPYSIETAGEDYSGILQMVKNMNIDKNNPNGQHLIQLYFTCLEQTNNISSQQGYSLPATLVYCIGQQANNIGLTIKGENALAPNTGWSWSGSSISGTPIGNDYFGAGQWANICYALTSANYQVITILRVENLTTLGQAMYGNYYGLIYNFNKGQSDVPDNVPQIINWNVGPANTN